MATTSNLPMAASSPAQKRRRPRCASGHSAAPLAKKRQRRAKTETATAEFLDELRGKALRPGPVASSSTAPDIVAVGSDCSGLGSELVALGHLPIIHFRAVFNSDKDKRVRKMHRHFHGKQSKMYGDVEEASSVRPKVDLYVAGPPCQPWSNLGQGQGQQDKKGRGIVFLSVLRYIAQVKPTLVVLENVRGMYDRHKEDMQEYLRKMTSAGYQVTWDIMQAGEHGAPQSRQRVYIIGFQKLAREFSFPQRLKIQVLVSKVLDHAPSIKKYHTFSSKTGTNNFKKCQSRLEKLGVDMDQETVFVDLHASTRFGHFRRGGLPCLTASRAAQGGFYITDQKRMTNVHELGRLQGFTTQEACLP